MGREVGYPIVVDVDGGGRVNKVLCFFLEEVAGLVSHQKS